jgi:hypothetical protein
MKSEVTKEINIKVPTTWNVTVCSWQQIPTFPRNLLPQSPALKTDFSETSIHIYQNTWRHILRGRTHIYKSISSKQQAVLRLHIALPDGDETQE